MKFIFGFIFIFLPLMSHAFPEMVRAGYAKCISCHVSPTAGGVLKDHALNKIAEIVHDIDLKDEKYGHEETVGFDQLVKGIVSRIDSDEERLQKASDMLDNFYEIFKNKK